MPATTPKSEAKTEAKNGNGRPEYVRCELSREQKDALKVWADDTSDSDLLAFIEKAVWSDDYVLSVKPLEVGCQASLTPAREKDQNWGRCLVTRGSTPLNALRSLAYKQEVVLKGLWAGLDRSQDFDL